MGKFLKEKLAPELELFLFELDSYIFIYIFSHNWPNTRGKDRCDWKPNLLVVVQLSDLLKYQ